MGCRHIFIRDGWQTWETWFPRRRWRCVECGLYTRSYDSIDKMGQRPIHRHMSVAMRGVNAFDLVIR